MMLGLFVSACGWHLRGDVRLPETYSNTYLSTEDEYTDFYRELRKALTASGVNVTTRPSLAGAIVRIRTDAAGQRVVAVSARNTPEEFQVFYAVDYSVDVDGVEWLSQQRVELTANYSYDTSLVLAKQREQRTMQEALAREVASQVVRRLASAKPPESESATDAVEAVSR
jgi:LPS-assembly lipoprotein